MSHWNHRVVKETRNGIITYEIREVFYNDNKEIGAITEEGVSVYSEFWDDDMTEEDCLKELRETVERFKRALKTPIVDADTIKFADLGVKNDNTP